MKCTRHSKMPNKDNRDEWVMQFITNESNFYSVKEWFDVFNTKGFSSWRTDLSKLTVFFRDESEYLIAVLKWV